jgi:selenophosphate synthetase-related protein
MIDWKKEFEIYLKKKFKKKLGHEVDIENIDVNTNINISTVNIEELAVIYAFDIMKEDYEHAKRILEELEIRNCIIKTITDKNTGTISVYNKSDTETVIADVKMKVLKDGMIIDFEKQNL